MPSSSRRISEVTATIGLMAGVLGANVLWPASTSAQTRPSLAGLQQQIDALQARLDRRAPEAEAFTGANVFLLIPSIQGDSVDSTHVDWIDGLAFGIGGSSDGGPPAFDEFVLIKQLDSATAKLLIAARDRTLLASATIDICSAGQCPLQYQLTDVTVTSVSPGITETLTLSYAEISATFTPDTGPPSVLSGPLDVGLLGGVVVGFEPEPDAFTVGSGNVNEIFVRFDTIQGSSVDGNHSDWSEALVLSGGHLRSSPSVELAEFVVIKPVDKATPLLLKALVQNSVLTTLTIELCQSLPTQDCFLTYAFSDARLRRVESEGENEEVAFTFDVLTQTFHSPTGDQTFIFGPIP